MDKFKLLRQQFEKKREAKNAKPDAGKEEQLTGDKEAASFPEKTIPREPEAKSVKSTVQMTPLSLKTPPSKVTLKSKAKQDIKEPDSKSVVIDQAISSAPKPSSSEPEKKSSAIQGTPGITVITSSHQRPSQPESDKTTAEKKEPDSSKRNLFSKLGFNKTKTADKETASSPSGAESTPVKALKPDNKSVVLQISVTSEKKTQKEPQQKPPSKQILKKRSAKTAAAAAAEPTSSVDKATEPDSSKLNPSKVGFNKVEGKSSVAMATVSLTSAPSPPAVDQKSKDKAASNKQTPLSKLPPKSPTKPNAGPQTLSPAAIKRDFGDNFPVDQERKCSLSDEKMQDIRETFAVFDKNRDGMITKEELGAVLTALGQRPTIRELQALIRSVDVDMSGTIDFEEFVKIFSHKISVNPEQELYEVFCIFDNDRDGFISPNELFEVLHKLGENITEREAQEMVREADLNRDGKVDYNEFKAILKMR